MIKLNPTQLAALRAIERNTVAGFVAQGRRCEMFGLDNTGARVTTLRALNAAGLVTWDAKDYRESVPAGPFGRTERWGYRTRTWVEVACRLTEAGRQALGAL